MTIPIKRIMPAVSIGLADAKTLLWLAEAGELAVKVGEHDYRKQDEICDALFNLRCKIEEWRKREDGGEFTSRDAQGVMPATDKYKEMFGHYRETLAGVVGKFALVVKDFSHV